MTPEWLSKHSTITKPFTVHNKFLEIPAGKIENERLIQAELIAPNTLTTTDDVVVTLTIAMDTALADSNDHDSTFAISDGTSFIGFHVVDKDNYHTHSPCFNIEGDATNTYLRNTISYHTNPKVNSRNYSSEITIQIKPNDRWGSCHTEHDEGTVNTVNYQRTLDMTKGVYFQMYRAHTHEKYYLKYIVANIYRD